MEKGTIEIYTLTNNKPSLKSLSVAGRYVISRFWTRKPILLTHSVTSHCNCRCQICDVWRKKTVSPELTTAEIFQMLDEAKKLNFVAYVAFGGEPLMRPDIIDILRHAHELGLYTSIITNGTLLSENAKKIANVVDLTWVSLDYDSEYHDKMRSHQGAFDKALTGIYRLRQAGGKIVINCVLSRLNIDVVSKMAKLSQKLEVKLAFDPMEELPGNEEYALTENQHKQLFQEVTELKERGYPIINSYEFIRNPSNTRYSCAQPNIFLRVSEDGKVEPFWCRKTNKTLGDLKKQSLNEIVYSNSFREFERTAHGCCLCKNSTTVETATFYSAKQFFMNYYNIYRWNKPYLKFIMDFILT